MDDDASVREGLGELLHAARFRARTLPSAEAFLASGGASAVDCLIAEVNLPGLSGVALVEALAGQGRAVSAVLITARTDSPHARDDAPGRIAAG